MSSIGQTSSAPRIHSGDPTHAHTIEGDIWYEVPMDEEKPHDLNENGIDDEIEPPFVDVTAGSKQLADRLQNNQGHGSDAFGWRYRCPLGRC